MREKRNKGRLRFALGAVLVLGACAPLEQQRRLDRLEVEERERRARLAELQTQIDESVALAAQAARRAQVAQCQARGAEIEAQVALASASCYEQIAEAKACDAANAKHKGDSTLLGCGLGVFAAVVSGGSLSGLALAGCGGGYVMGEATTTTCNEAPVCLGEAERWFEQAAAAKGLTGLPLCGTGIEVAVRAGGAIGVPIVRVSPDYGADLAGLRPGDVITSVGSLAVDDADAIRAAMERVTASWVVVGLVRDGVSGFVQVPLVEASAATGDARPRLGVDLGTPAPVRFGALTVVAVEPGSSAETAGVLVGDEVASIDDQFLEPAAASEAAAAKGGAVALYVARGGTFHHLQLR